MIAALVAIAFIGILAAVVAVSTMTNYRLRAMNYKSKITFYSAESALEEIYAGLSKDCYTQLERAYQSTILSLSGSDNAAANTKLKTLYFNYIKELGGACWTDDTLTMAYLNSFISDTDNARVIAVDTSSAVLDASPMKIPDVVVQYRESATDDFSTVAVDLVIAYPSVEFSFINDVNNLKSYLDYNMIGMEGIYVTATAATASGGSYAGSGYPSGTASDGGLTVGNGAVFSLVKGSAASPTVLVADDKINVYGQLNVAGASLWTDNINVGYDKTTAYAGVLMYDGSYDSYTYVADDLTMAGKDSVVVLGSYYYGYSASALTASKSSGIIINGLNSTFDAGSVKEMLIGGKAFISLGSGADYEYMTGDVVGLKGSQEIYLVPTAYMNITNPCLTTESNLANAVDTEALTDGFFAADLLDASSPYTMRAYDGSSYFYLNFKNDASRSEYVNRILTNGAGSSDETLAKLYRTLQNSAGSYISSAGLSINETAVVSSGTLYQVSDGNISSNTTSYTDISSSYYEYTNRYLGMKLYLYDTADTAAGYPQTVTNALLSNGDSVYITNSDGTTDEHVVDTAQNIYDYVIDTERFSSGETTVEVSDVLSGDTAVAAIAAVLLPVDADGNAVTGYTLSGLKGKYGVFDGGVILAYDVDITVDADFEGLIITNRKINVVNPAKTICANHTLVDQVINENGFLAKYFFAYQSSSGELDPENIGPDDLLSFTDWRKNYEVVITPETASE